MSYLSKGMPLQERGLDISLATWQLYFVRANLNQLVEGAEAGYAVAVKKLEKVL